MPKGVFAFPTMKDLIARLDEQLAEYGRKAPSRPTLYRIEDTPENRSLDRPCVWKATKNGANNWRIFNEEDLDKAVNSILEYCGAR